jgi:hypothetical protein
MEPIAQRLKSFLQHKELNTTAFCRIMRYRSCEKIARLFRLNNAKPSVDILEDIAHHFTDLDMRWLLTGEGEMLVTPPAVPALPETPASKEDARLLVLHTASNDQYIIHQSYPSFILQSNGPELVKVSRVTLTHSEREMEKVSKPVLGTLINFIENMRDEN